MYLDSVQQDQLRDLLRAYYAGLYRKSLRRSNRISNRTDSICLILIGLLIGCWWQGIVLPLSYPWLFALVITGGAIGQRLACRTLLPLPDDETINTEIDVMVESFPATNPFGCFLFGQMLTAWDNHQPTVAIEFMEECQEETGTSMWPYWGIVTEVLFSE